MPPHLRESYMPSSRLLRDRSDSVAHRCPYTRHPQLYLRKSHMDTFRDQYRGMFLVLLRRESFAPLHGAMEVHHRVAHEWAQFFACRQIAFIDLSKTDRLGS